MKQTVVIVGVGYVGLELALAFAKAEPTNLDIIAYDNNKERIRMLKDGIDSNLEFDSEDINQNILYTDNLDDIKDKDYYIFTIGTYANRTQPDVDNLVSAIHDIASVSNKLSTFVIESTVYPGFTNRARRYFAKTFDVVPDAIRIGYSPERVSPGFGNDRISMVDEVKLIACDEPIVKMDLIGLYLIIANDVKMTDVIEEAELSKLIENTARDINIAFANEVAMISKKYNVSTKRVMDLADTKKNFVRYNAGLVGGHCIPVDPWYLYQAGKDKDLELSMVKAARNTNDKMVDFVAEETLKLSPNTDRRILILGTAYKADTLDDRNSLTYKLKDRLKDQGYSVSITDIYNVDNEADDFINDMEAFSQKWDLVIVAVGHAEYKARPIEMYKNLFKGEMLIMDIPGIIKDAVWSLNG